MLLVAITSFTTKEIYIKNSCNYNIFFMLKLHINLYIYIIYIHYETEIEMLQKNITKYTTHILLTLGFFKSKPLQCPQ